MDIENEIKKRAYIFDQELKNFLRRDKPEKLYDAIRHLPIAGGKRLRPCIAMISCEAVSGDISKVMPLAIALELVHNFTLVHDDIMDKSKLRRGKPAVHIKFGEPTAIMAGDLLFAKSFESMHNIIDEPFLFKKVEFGLINCIIQICEGQQLDIEFENRKIVSEKEYIKMICKKTAIFFQYAAEAGGILGGGNKKQVNSLKEYGLLMGIGFQIWDDYLDLSSNEETLGKDIGNDIRNGKKTLIACHCLANAKAKDKKTLEQVFGNNNATDTQIQEVYQLFNKIGSIKYAKNTALDYCQRSKKAIEILPESNSKEILMNFADYVIKRIK